MARRRRTAARPRRSRTPKSDEEQHGYPAVPPGRQQVLFSIRRERTWHLARLTLRASLTGGSWATDAVVGEGAQYLPTGHLRLRAVRRPGRHAVRSGPGSLDQPRSPCSSASRPRDSAGRTFAVAARAGTLVYVPAGATIAERTLLRVDRDGRAAPLIDARAPLRVAGVFAGRTPRGGHDRVRERAATSGSSTSSAPHAHSLHRREAPARFPCGAPDGSTIAFQSTAPGPWNLFWKPLDASADAAAVPERAAAPTRAAILAEHRRRPAAGHAADAVRSRPAVSDVVVAATARRWPFTSESRTANATSGPSRPAATRMPFLMTPFDERSPRFSPDGKWLAYVSDESRPRRGVRPALPRAGTEVARVHRRRDRSGVVEATAASCSTAQRRPMMVASVTAKREFSAPSRPRRLFEIRFDAGDNGPNYDVSPDGTWFVMPRSDQARPPGRASSGAQLVRRGHGSYGPASATLE